MYIRVCSYNRKTSAAHHVPIMSKPHLWLKWQDILIQALPEKNRCTQKENHIVSCNKVKYSTHLRMKPMKISKYQQQIERS